MQVEIVRRFVINFKHQVLIFGLVHCYLGRCKYTTTRSNPVGQWKIKLRKTPVVVFL